jgi:hypothetical protein
MAPNIVRVLCRMKFVLALIRFEEILAMGFDDEHSDLDSQFGGPPDAGSRPTFIS